MSPRANVRSFPGNSYAIGRCSKIKTREHKKAKVQFKKFLTGKIVTLSLTVSVLTAFLGIYAAPMATKNDSPTGLVGVVCFLILPVFIFFMLSYLLVSARKLQSPEPESAHFKKFSLGLLLLLLIGIAVTLLLSLICGGISVLLYAFLKNTLTFSQIKETIDLASSIIFLLTFPIFISVLLNFTFDNKTVWGSIKDGMKQLKTLYLRILLILSGIWCAGYLMVVLLGSIANLTVADACGFAACAIIGTFIFPYVFALYESKK